MLARFKDELRARAGDPLDEFCFACGSRNGEQLGASLIPRGTVVNIELLHAFLRDSGGACGCLREVVIELHSDRVLVKLRLRGGGRERGDHNNGEAHELLR